jgi:hypothetical protein
VATVGVTLRNLSRDATGWTCPSEICALARDRPEVCLDLAWSIFSGRARRAVLALESRG